MKIVFNLLFVAISAILCLSSAFEDTRKPFPERRELFADTNRNIIVGGQIAPQGRYTYIAGLFFSTSASLPGCGGTLIASNVVLSAAHCAGPVRVKLGCYQVNSDCTQTLSISQQIVHPSYNGNTYANDFMILVLSGAATTVSPIPFVADGTYETTIPDGQDVTVMGWGTTSSGGSQSSTLREVEVDVMTNSACQAKYTGYTIAANMICGARTGKDSCQGDSGGPLVIRCDTTKQDILVGVVSWGVGCADSRYPGVYSRVSNGWGTFIQARLSTLGVLNQLTTPPPVANACTAGTTAAPTPAPTRFPTPAPTNFPTPAPVPGTTGTPTPAPTNFPTPAPLPTVTVPPVTPGVPSGWTCTASFYNARDGCDCECGVEDPDCDIAGQTVYNCQTGETCSGGQCVQLTTSAPTPFPTPAPTPFPPGVPAAWTCRASYYNANDGCDCNCGAFDPDCLKAGNDLYNCGSGQYCATTGVCANVPSAWTCNKEYYAHADGCDCACGTKDPDCDIPGATLYHCSTGQVCSAIGTCINSVGFSRPQPISFEKDAEQPIRKKISKMGYKPFTPYTIPEPDDA